jgi:hypothetical protein
MVVRPLPREVRSIGAAVRPATEMSGLGFGFDLAVTSVGFESGRPPSNVRVRRSVDVGVDVVRVRGEATASGTTPGLGGIAIGFDPVPRGLTGEPPRGVVAGGSGMATVGGRELRGVEPTRPEGGGAVTVGGVGFGGAFIRGGAGAGLVRTSGAFTTGGRDGPGRGEGDETRGGAMVVGGAATRGGAIVGGGADIRGDPPTVGGEAFWPNASLASRASATALAIPTCRASEISVRAVRTVSNDAMPSASTRRTGFGRMTDPLGVARADCEPSRGARRRQSTPRERHHSRFPAGREGRGAEKRHDPRPREVGRGS